ncbi:hypothetical protein SCMU_00360 [Sinomonas cyclohexanicum]|uniref:ATP-grasp domain-containing protein n=1 Tax=Sinomonas cyclohexanicum TaxID=322009 RepID=A0ABM7PPR0_SINCY|nr:ATP-grasp domain-containing protein [Corynebacterium cyclohexanicum]BCT74194.1 hypothetical protein SCMU_00360 [Corynebacterium cyclohexanicum]
MGDLTLLAPTSVTVWYEPLGGDPASMIPIGEGGPVPVERVQSIAGAAAGGAVRIHSGHDSLLRDSDLAGELRRQGAEVHAQSSTAVAAGRDKSCARILMREAGVPLTPWGIGQVPDRSDVLVKARDSTQSRSIRWAGSAGPIQPDSYWEQWIDGFEFSVTGYRERGLTLLPIVAKGRTRRDLLPPWRRLRWVRSGDQVPLADAMYEAAGRAAEALDIWGFFEVEFVAREGVALVIEVNPRISGTLRLAAMAADIGIFAPGVFTANPTVIQPVLSGVEIPFKGNPILEPGLIATSRLTCVGESIQEALRRVAAHVPETARILEDFDPEATK